MERITPPRRDVARLSLTPEGREMLRDLGAEPTDRAEAERVLEGGT